MKNILVLGTGTQGLVLVRLIHECGYRVVMIANDRGNYADVSRYVDQVYYCNEIGEEGKLAFIHEVIDKEKVCAIIPTGDANAEFLCKHQDGLLTKVRFELPTFKNFLRGYDKNQLMDLCKQNGYPHPYTIDLSVTEITSNEVRDFPYPGMLKPNCTTGGRGMVEIKTYSELLERYPDLHKEYGEYHLQKFIKPGGRQLKVQLYIDKHKTILAHSVQQKLRWYPNKGGSNTCAVSVEDDDLVRLCTQILRDIDWIGFADFDFIEDPDTGELLAMEINPRLPACIKGSIVAGINWGEIIVNDYLGLPQKKYEYKTGVYLRHIGLDFLWFLNADNKWTAKPNWFKLFGPNIYYQDASSWTDPLPFIIGTWNNIKKIFNPQFRKSKQG